MPRRTYSDSDSDSSSSDSDDSGASGFGATRTHRMTKRAVNEETSKFRGYIAQIKAEITQTQANSTLSALQKLDDLTEKVVTARRRHLDQLQTSTPDPEFLLVTHHCYNLSIIAWVNSFERVIQTAQADNNLDMLIQASTNLIEHLYTDIKLFEETHHVTADFVEEERDAIFNMFSSITSNNWANKIDPLISYLIIRKILAQPEDVQLHSLDQFYISARESLQEKFRPSTDAAVCLISIYLSEQEYPAQHSDDSIDLKSLTTLIDLCSKFEKVKSFVKLTPSVDEKIDFQKLWQTIVDYFCKTTSKTVSLTVISTPNPDALIDQAVAASIQIVERNFFYKPKPIKQRHFWCCIKNGRRKNI